MTTPKVIVTGGTGYVGNNLVRYFLEKGWRIHAIIRPQSDRSLLPKANDLSVHEHDGSMDSMLSIISETKPNAVFHLASLFLAHHHASDIDNMVRSNILFGAQLVEAMMLSKIPVLINTGTAWQHFEGHKYNPVNLYAATKQAFEVMLNYYIEAHGLRVITLELHDTYGPDDPRPKIANLLRHVAETDESLAMSPGDQKINPVHIQDVARAFQLACKRLLDDEQIKHEKFSVIPSKSVTLKQLVSEFEFVLGRSLCIRWGERPYRDREVLNPWVGKTLPGWKPSIDLRTGLRELLRI